MMRLDFYCKVSQDGVLSVSDADRLIEIMKEGGLCILPSDSSYMLTGNIMMKGVAAMKRFERLLLFSLALAVGGVSGYALCPPGSGLLNWIAFMVACLLLGQVFHQIDKWICGRHEK